MSDVEEQLNEFVVKVCDRLKSQQTEINELKPLVNSLTEQVKALQLKTELLATTAPTVVPNVVPTATPSNPVITQPILQYIETEDLTKLPAYKYASAFKEIKRPTTINDLYMMVLQSQRTIYELQMNTDNILRRS